MRYSQFSIRAFSCVTVLALATFTIVADIVATENAENRSSEEFRVGFDGHSRLGAWFPVFVKIDQEVTAASYEIDTLDADGLPVTQAGQVTVHPNGWLECLMQAGRKHGECKLRLTLGDEGLASRSFRLNDATAGHTIHPSTQALTAVIESGKAIASTIETSSRFARTTKSVIVSIAAGDPLPTNGLAWQCVETMVISTGGLEWLHELSDQQWNALETWVDRGGRLVLSIPPTDPRLISDGGPLEVFCPGDFSRAAQFESSSRVEFYADANEQLIARGGDPIEACRLDAVQGRVELTQDSLPLVISQAKGFGSVTFVGFDLSDPRFTDWKGFSGLLKRILYPTSDRDDVASLSRNTSQGNRVSHVGYTDLAGQLRLALDRFPSVTFVSFASIATLIGLFILCIGPGDYFLLSKLFRKMEMTWLTFPVVSLAFCGMAYCLARSVRPADLRLNQLEIVDIDQHSNLARSSVWTHFYSPTGGSCSIELPTKPAIDNQLKQKIVSWQGLPGDGLGGMSTKATNSLIGRSYRQVINGPPKPDDLQIGIQNQPLRVSSTRALFSQWWSDTPFEVESKLRLNRRTRHIEGTFTNPLDRPLKNCQLMFGEYTYKLPAKLAAGEEIDILGDDLREQTTRSFLNRRAKDADDANRATKIPWNPTSTHIDRLAEILMFYSAAGGQEYTGLSHGYQSFVDLTDHLHLSRAILVGELDELVTPLQIDGVAVNDAYDSTKTLVRIIFPVEIR